MANQRYQKKQTTIVGIDYSLNSPAICIADDNFDFNKCSFHFLTSKKKHIGKFGKILELIHSKNCKKVIFAGNISRPKISGLNLDLKGMYYLPRIIKASKLGDAAILKELIKILAENKIKVIKLNFFNPELTLKKGNYTKLKPNKFDILEIKKGINYLNNLNKIAKIGMESE